MILTLQLPGVWIHIATRRWYDIHIDGFRPRAFNVRIGNLAWSRPNGLRRV